MYKKKQNIRDQDSVFHSTVIIGWLVVHGCSWRNVSASSARVYTKSVHQSNQADLLKAFTMICFKHLC